MRANKRLKLPGGDRLTEELPIAELSSADAVRLGDLVLIAFDLSLSLDCCSRLIELYDKKVEDHLLGQALWTCALVHYVRCFATGKRSGLNETILETLPGEPVETHRYYKGLRDKHTAHSVNPLEQVTVGVILSLPESAERRVEGVAALMGRQLYAGREEAEGLRRLAAAVRSKVLTLRKDLEGRIIKDAAARPIDELYTGRRGRVTIPGREQLAKPRAGTDGQGAA